MATGTGKTMCKCLCGAIFELTNPSDKRCPNCKGKAADSGNGEKAEKKGKNK